MEKESKYLAVDYGDKRIGIAVSDENKKYSFSREHLQNDRNLFSNLLDLIKEENIIKIIIGYPLNFKSEKTIQTIKTEEFRNNLEKFLEKYSVKAELIYFDERFTSRLAAAGISNSGLNRKKRQEKGRVDSISAQIILQDYIDKTNNLNIYS